MRHARFLRSSTIRLTVFYAAVFAGSALILLGFVYWTVVQHMTDQLEHSIETEISELATNVGPSPSARLARTVDELIARWPHDPILYRVDDATGHALAGNMPALRDMAPAGRGWFTATSKARNVKGEVQNRIKIKAVRLSDGGTLLIGESTDQIDQTQDLVLKAALSGLAVTILLAGIGGMLMSRRVLRQIETINRTSSEIMEGDLSRRIPLQGSDDEYDRLGANLNSMLDRIQSLMEGMRQVSSEIAHDLRTPLTRLRSRLETARARASTVEEYAEAVDKAIAETDQVLATFRALLRIAQLEAGGGRAGFTEVDLGDLLRQLVEVYEPVGEERGSRITIGQTCQARVSGDPALLLQMFSNLMENALRHTPAGTSIDIRLQDAGSHPLVTIADTGPGIPAEFRDRVFRRFFRLDASRSTPGSGLGLSLVAAVCLLHGIQIELGDNKPGLRISMLFARDHSLPGNVQQDADPIPADCQNPADQKRNTP